MEKVRKKKNLTWLFVSIFLIFRFFAIEHFAVPSCSMTPTLNTGDIILLKKWSYSYSRQSLPFGGYLPFFKKGITLGSPKRGEIAIFTLPRDPSTYYVKRIVGIAGDTVQMKDGVLHVNDKASKVNFLSKYKFKSDAGEWETGDKYEVQLPDADKPYAIYRDRDFGYGHIDNTPQFKVPDGHVWMQGDYNTGSDDSFNTHFMGPVPVENLSGTVFFVLYSTNARIKPEASWISWFLQMPWRILVALKETRFDRIFISVS